MFDSLEGVGKLGRGGCQICGTVCHTSGTHGTHFHGCRITSIDLKMIKQMELEERSKDGNGSIGGIRVDIEKPRL